jgi:glycosyltransferase involved in cell wall biosynthesis
MLNKPFFSVIIPLYNKECHIQNTIESVLNQTFTDFEIIIVNDGSTDGSFNIVKKITDSRISSYTNKNNGLSYSRNYGIKKAKAKYIALLDADDLWMEDYLECISSFIKKHHKEYVFAANNYTWFKKKSPNLKSNANIKCDVKLIDDYFNSGKNLFSYSSVIFHKSVFDKIGYFNETVNHGEEEEFSIRCFLNYNLVYIIEPKVFYLKNINNQLTAPNKNRKRILPDYESYLTNNPNGSLNKYIDFIHFKLLVLFKMEKNYKLVKLYKKKINVANLTCIQKMKFYLPTNFFYITKHIYIWFSNRLIHS